MKTYLSREKAARLSRIMAEYNLIMVRAEHTFMFLSRILEGGDYENEEHIADVAALAGCALAGFSEKHEDDFLAVQKALSEHAEGENAP